MLTMIKADLFRIFKQKTIYVLLGVILVYILLVGLNGNTGIDNYYVGYSSYHTLSVDSILFFLVPFIVINIIGVEIKEGTIINFLSVDTDRRKIFYSKYIVYTIIYIALMIFGSLFSILLFSITNGYGKPFEIIDIFNLIQYIIRCFSLHTLNALLLMILSLFIYKESFLIISFFALEIIMPMLAGRILGGGIVEIFFPWCLSWTIIDMSIPISSFYVAFIILCLWHIVFVWLGAKIFEKADL